MSPSISTVNCLENPPFLTPDHLINWLEREQPTVRLDPDARKDAEYAFKTQKNCGAPEVEAKADADCLELRRKIEILAKKLMSLKEKEDLHEMQRRQKAAEEAEAEAKRKKAEEDAAKAAGN